MFVLVALSPVFHAACLVWVQSCPTRRTAPAKKSSIDVTRIILSFRFIHFSCGWVAGSLLLFAWLCTNSRSLLGRAFFDGDRIASKRLLILFFQHFRWGPQMSQIRRASSHFTLSKRRCNYKLRNRTHLPLHRLHLDPHVGKPMSSKSMSAQASHAPAPTKIDV